MSHLLFAGNDYYPAGGAEDFIASFDSLEAAKTAHDPSQFKYDGGWANVLDTESMQAVAFFSRGTWYTPEQLASF